MAPWANSLPTRLGSVLERGTDFFGSGGGVALEAGRSARLSRSMEAKVSLDALMFLGCFSGIMLALD